MRVLELFSGAGGLAAGLEAAGFETALLVERDSHASATLRRNFPKVEVFEGDVQDVNFATIKDIELVAGGPPCQPFSLGGKHGAWADGRDMFPEAVRAVKELSPKVFLFENVKGLLRPSFAPYFEYIIRRLTFPTEIQGHDEFWQQHSERLGAIVWDDYPGVKYRVKFKILNAADFGVPQKRERVFILGTRADLNLDWKFPEPTHSKERLLWDQYVTGEYWQRHGIEPVSAEEKRFQTLNRFGMLEPSGQAWVTIRDALHNIPDPIVGSLLDEHAHRPGARQYPGHTGSAIDMPAKTIKAGGHGVPGGENMILFPDDSVRYFTVLEGKLVQTFPPDFSIAGSWGESMRQIGNAVPVRLAKILGLEIRDLISASANAG
jgi:DNA (cytosine-5)-methyltransferase 1